MRAAATALAVLAAAALASADTMPFNVADITSMTQFRSMSDAQLEQVYAAGSAVMPSQEPP